MRQSARALLVHFLGRMGSRSVAEAERWGVACLVLGFAGNRGGDETERRVATCLILGRAEYIVSLYENASRVFIPLAFQTFRPRRLCA